MRVLIVSALFACACAAPSGLAPLVAPVVAVPGVPVAPVNSGDLQAAFIDAKVQTEDLLRSVADKQREVVEQAVVENNEKVIEVNDQVKERAIETFWSEQDKKWQAYDAAQTAQAQLDGTIASTSDAVAKSLVVPGLTAVVSPYIVAPGVVAPGLVASNIVTPVIAPGLKAAEPVPEKVEEKPEEPKTDSVQVETADVKTAAVEKELTQPKYVVGQTPLLASFPLSTVGLAPQPWAPVVLPGLKTVVPVGAVGAHLIAPTVIKNIW